MRLSSLDPDHLECRSMGHAWKHVDDHDHMTASSNRYQITRFWRLEECLRCGAERDREIDLSGLVVRLGRTRMHYPTGYVLKAPPRRLTRADALGAQYGKDLSL